MGDNHHEIQWEIFRIQQMEVLLLYHFSGHMNCGDISPYIGLKQMVGTSVLNRFLASMAIDHPEFSNVYSIKKNPPEIQKKNRGNQRNNPTI